MTLEELKDVLSTYGVNDEERGAAVLVTINGTPVPVVAAEVTDTWYEDEHAWREPLVVSLEVAP